MVPPLDFTGGDKNIKQRSYPLVLKPHVPVLVYLYALETFRNDMRPILDGGRSFRKVSARLLRGRVVMGHSAFPVRFHRSLRKELKAAGH
jgi:hypothetical protein